MHIISSWKFGKHFPSLEKKTYSCYWFGITVKILHLRNLTTVLRSAYLESWMFCLKILCPSCDVFIGYNQTMRASFWTYSDVHMHWEFQVYSLWYARRQTCIHGPLWTMSLLSSLWSNKQNHTLQQSCNGRWEINFWTEKKKTGCNNHAAGRVLQWNAVT